MSELLFFRSFFTFLRALFLFFKIFRGLNPTWNNQMLESGSSDKNPGAAGLWEGMCFTYGLSEFILEEFNIGKEDRWRDFEDFYSLWFKHLRWEIPVKKKKGGFNMHKSLQQMLDYTVDDINIHACNLYDLCRGWSPGCWLTDNSGGCTHKKKKHCFVNTSQWNCDPF